MRLFPSLTEEFTSPLSPPELLRRVQDGVQLRREFTGAVAGNNFTIRRVIDSRNSMLPRVEGWVTGGRLRRCG